MARKLSARQKKKRGIKLHTKARSKKQIQYYPSETKISVYNVIEDVLKNSQIPNAIEIVNNFRESLWEIHDNPTLKVWHAKFETQIIQATEEMKKGTEGLLNLLLNIAYNEQTLKNVAMNLNNNSDRVSELLSALKYGSSANRVRSGVSELALIISKNELDTDELADITGLDDYTEMWEEGLYE